MRLRRSLVVLGALCFSTVPITALSPSDIPSDTPVSQLIESANANLARGNAQAALVYFDAAIHRNPSDYLTIFKRGATYLSLGKNAQASKDFDQVLLLKPGFEGALTQRAKIRARTGDWAAAKEDYTAAKKKDTQDWQDLAEAEEAERLSKSAEEEGKWEDCASHASTAILVASTSLELRQRRARCRFEQGQIMEALSDLNHVLQINPGNPEPYLQVSAMSFYSLGETDTGTSAASKCLHNDPDNKACLKLRKSEKAIDRTLKKFTTLKEKRQFASAVKLLIPKGDDPGLLQEVKEDVETWKNAGYIHPHAPNGLYGSLVESTCAAYTEMNNFKKATPFCEEALTFNHLSLPALLNQAQRQIDADEFEPALGTLNQAREEHGDTQKIQELMQKAQQLLRRSKQKDYYQVLGVSRDADERDIKKAFRKLTVQHHPDKAAKNGYTQEEAQKKMAAINEAYEVLSDPELKARFDHGEDPNDPHAGNGGNPFQGSPFGWSSGGQPVFFSSQGGGQRQFKFSTRGGMPDFGDFPGGFPFE